jgi:hypothetical protein
MFIPKNLQLFPKIPKSRHLAMLTSQLTTLLPREIGVGVGEERGLRQHKNKTINIFMTLAWD